MNQHYIFNVYASWGFRINVWCMQIVICSIIQPHAKWDINGWFKKVISSEMKIHLQISILILFKLRNMIDLYNYHCQNIFNWLVIQTWIELFFIRTSIIITIHTTIVEGMSSYPTIIGQHAIIGYQIKMRNDWSKIYSV